MASVARNGAILLYRLRPRHRRWWTTTDAADADDAISSDSRQLKRISRMLISC
jgi:hypothetical protein